MLLISQVRNFGNMLNCLEHCSYIHKFVNKQNKTCMQSHDYSSTFDLDV